MHDHPSGERHDALLLVGVCLFAASLVLAVSLSGTVKEAVVYMLAGLAVGAIARRVLPPSRVGLDTDTCFMFGLAGSTISGELAAWAGADLGVSAAVAAVGGAALVLVVAALGRQRALVR
jgi:hypothetical protein